MNRQALNRRDLISGQHYEQEYLNGDYRKRYINDDFPKWAADYNRYYVGLIAAYLGIPLHARILDLGSGVGRYIEAWQEIGYRDVTGLEISHEAILHASGAPNIVQGSVAQMPFGDGEFDLVFSAALLEHVAEEIEAATIAECYRVGKSQAHMIATSAGGDPGHINIKTMHEWSAAFQAGRKDTITILMPDVFLGEYPIMAVVPATTEYSPLIKCVNRNKQMEEITDAEK